MIDVISLLLIFLINSLPLTTTYGIVTMPYVTYLAFCGNIKSGVLLFVVGILMSLQGGELFPMMLFLIVNYIIFYLFFTYLSYNLENIVFIVCIQGLLWFLYHRLELDLTQSIISVVGYFIVNYILMRKVK